MDATTVLLGIIVALISLCGVFYLVRGIKALLSSQQEEQPLVWHQQLDLMLGLMMLFGAAFFALAPFALALLTTSRNGVLLIPTGLLILAWLVCLIRSVILQQRKFRRK